MTPTPERLLVPISVGELLDKITILEIKRERIGDPGKRRSVLHELAALEEARDAHLAASADLDQLVTQLRDVNAALWDIEDEIRICESRGDFGPRFVELARSVYIRNDERAQVKRKINALAGSEFVEEKSYADYRRS
jgi:hypothetical protein